MKKPRKRREFTKEFKAEAVRLVLEMGQSQSRVSQDLGIGYTALNRWVREFREDGREAFPGKGHLTPEKQRISDLERENRLLTQERDILKKAMAYFAEVPK